MCAQLHFPMGYEPRIRIDRSDTPIGIPPHEAQIGLEQDCVKELINKIAWVLGSVYQVNYSNMSTPARGYAWRIVKKVIEDHGYPSKIRK